MIVVKPIGNVIPFAKYRCSTRAPHGGSCQIIQFIPRPRPAPQQPATRRVRA